MKRARESDEEDNKNPELEEQTLFKEADPILKGYKIVKACVNPNSILPIRPKCKCRPVLCDWDQEDFCTCKASMFAFCKREREGSHAWVGGAYSLFDETFNIILRLVSCAHRFALLGCRVDFSYYKAWQVQHNNLFGLTKHEEITELLRLYFVSLINDGHLTTFKLLLLPAREGGDTWFHKFHRVDDLFKACGKKSVV